MGNPYKPRKRIVEEAVVEETAVETPETEETVSDEAPETVETVSDEVPEGTIKEVLDWVGEDADKAVEALTAEEAGERRKTLIKSLEEIIEGA